MELPLAWRLVCTATVVRLVPALGWENMHIVLGFCSRAIVLQKNEGDQNGRVPGLQECTPNLCTFMCAIKKVDTGKLFPLLGSPSQHRRERDGGGKEGGVLTYPKLARGSRGRPKRPNC